MYIQGIRTVLFDWGKVVAIHDNRRTARAFRPYSRLPDITDDEVERLVFRDNRPVFDQLMLGAIGPEEYRSFVRGLLRLSSGFDDAALDAAFADVFVRNEQMIYRIRDLSRKGVTLTAVSNMDALRHRQLRRLGVHDLFDHHVLSYVEGVMKPDPEIYRLAFERSGTAPRETLFIDDHPENTEAAQQLGAQVWTYDHREHDRFERFIRELKFIG